MHDSRPVAHDDFRCKMSHRLPPLNGLRSFEAAARHLSFTRAADELCVTPGAVSQQVKSLEKALGVALFRRLTRSLVLTEEGEAYLPAIQSAFAIISKATDATAPALRGRTLRLGISPQIVQMAGATVRKLRQEGKDTVTVKVSDDVAELLKGKLDALLRVSGASYPGLHVDRLALAGVDAMQTPIVLLTPPGLAGCREHRGLLRRLKDMA